MRGIGRRWGLAVAAAFLLLGGAAFGPGAKASPADGNPTLTEITEGQPKMGIPLAEGYEDHEYYLDGAARAYPGSDGQRTPYRTRVYLRLPTDPNRFSGTVFVEWYNVSAQQDTNPDTAQAMAELLRRGHGIMAVSAQQAGVRYLQTTNPARYGTLNHPGDEYSFDIFSQAGYVLKNPNGDDPLAGLRETPKKGKHQHKTVPVDLKLLASGNSQSAGRLSSYIRNGALREGGIYDALLITAGGSTTFNPAVEDVPSVPTIHLQSESEATSQSPTPFGHDLYRVWWVAGTSHVDHWGFWGTRDLIYDGSGIDVRDKRDQGQYGELGGPGGPSCAVRQNQFPKRFAYAAAVRHLDTWMRGGPAAPQGTGLFEFDPTTGRPKRDADGNIVGGTRLAPMDVPVAEYNGQSCALLGHTIPFDDLKLRSRYPTHQDYLDQLEAAIQADVAGGFLVPEDADELRQRAQAAAFRWEGPLSVPPPVGG